MRRANSRSLRVSVVWKTVESSNGDRDFAQLDALFEMAAANGVRVLPALVGPAPDGLNDPPTNRRSRKAFARFAGALAKRYGRLGTVAQDLPVKTWQLLNEQNGRVYWGARPSPRAYGRLVKVAARKIRRADRGAEIALGGMFGTPSGSGSIASWTYLQKLYRVQGIKRAFDTVAVHPYSPSLRGITYQIRKLRAVMAQSGDRRAKLRVTELGWGSAKHGNLNEGRKGQARMLRKAFRLLESKRRAWKIRGVNWFSWRDDPSGACSFCPTAGLFTFDREAKPSWRAFKRIAR